ncbi:MAG TPA: DUF11 domain-containing protein [Candidatus Acidoferrum sp.]|nr:DUF11 domain-containing protein [Candidatus Acidoferrum sp.]
MRVHFSLRTVAWLALGIALALGRLEAQTIRYVMGASPSPVAVSNNVTYTLVVSNQMGVSLSITVTNTFSGTAFQFVGLPTASQGTPTTTANQVIFSLGLMTNNAVAQMGMILEPTSVGSLTNLQTVATNGAYYGDAPPFVVLVTNVMPVADLAVGIAAPAAAVFTNDLMIYSVSVTNLGPGAAPSVFLTNTLPPGVVLKAVSPTNQSAVSSNLVFNLGTLTNGAVKQFQISIVPTNAGTLTLSAGVSTNTVLDTNTVNDTAAVDVTVGTFAYGQLIATNVSAMVFNPQTGLMNQTVRLTNIGSNNVAAARVIVAGLTNRLYNAVGTNSGNPYVVYNAELDTNQFVDLVLEYFVSTRLPVYVDNTNYTAVGVPFTDLSITGGTNAGFSITLMTNLPNGNILIEFQSLPGSNYTVVYSSDSLFTSAQAAQPSIVAPANRTQWIDDGPPKTVSAPTNAPSRFYRVRLNP